ncbi:hypothetical protein C8R48DRAFT_770639 [Suillus tomentosus]|nr:hypothetical protein C8R48DRAFT_770639 [Suillus tomentosus]
MPTVNKNLKEWRCLSSSINHVTTVVFCIAHLGYPNWLQFYQRYKTMTPGDLYTEFFCVGTFKIFFRRPESSPISRSSGMAFSERLAGQAYRDFFEDARRLEVEESKEEKLAELCPQPSQLHIELGVLHEHALDKESKLVADLDTMRLQHKHLDPAHGLCSSTYTLASSVPTDFGGVLKPEEVDVDDLIDADVSAQTFVWLDNDDLREDLDEPSTLQLDTLTTPTLDPADAPCTPSALTGHPKNMSTPFYAEGVSVSKAVFRLTSFRRNQLEAINSMAKPLLS